MGTILKIKCFLKASASLLFGSVRNSITPFYNDLALPKKKLFLQDELWLISRLLS